VPNNLTLGHWREDQTSLPEESVFAVPQDRVEGSRQRIPACRLQQEVIPPDGISPCGGRGSLELSSSGVSVKPPVAVRNQIGAEERRFAWT